MPTPTQDSDLLDAQLRNHPAYAGKDKGASAAARQASELERHKPPSASRDENYSSATIYNLIASARTAQFGRDHVPIGHDMPAWSISKRAAAVGTLNLSTGYLSTLFDKDGKLTRAPHAAIAGNTIKLSTGVVRASRIAAAGAHVIICPDLRRAIPTGRTGDVVFSSIPKQFRTIAGAAFAVVADDAEVGISTHPALSADIDWEASTQLGVRMEFSRQEQKALPGDLLSAEIEAAIVLGIARAADATLLTKLASLTPGAFTISKAATQGLKFGELAGLVGTAGNGATVSTDGTLRIAGVLAEMTSDIAGSYVGAWDRAAIAVHEEVELLVERLDTKGNMAITAFVNLIPLFPDPSKFWSVPSA